MKKLLLIPISLFAFSFAGNSQCNPVISGCPGNITQPVTAGNCDETVIFTPPTFTGCPTGTLVQTAGLPSGSAFPSGTTINRFEVMNESVIFEEDFADNLAGWTLDTEWAIGSAVAGCNDPGTDNTPTADNGIAGVVLGGCASTGLHGYYYITSPIINTAAGGSGDVTLDFYRWLNSDYTPYMQNQVQVFDGSAWVTLWETAGSPGISDATWNLQSYDLTPYSNANLQVRFGFTIGSGGVFSVGQWNLDDVSIKKNVTTGVMCEFTVNTNAAPELTACQADSTLINTGEACSEVFNYTMPTATDCSTLTTTMISGLASGSAFPLGTTTVEYEIKENKPTYLDEDFSDALGGWTLDTDWEIGSAMPSSCGGLSDPSMDNTNTSDNGVAGVVIGGCAPTNVHPFYYITSPIVDMSAVTEQIELQYYRWLNSDYTPYMQNHVQVYDGTSWITLWQTGASPGVADNSWVYQNFDVTEYLNADFQVRFGFEIGSSGAFSRGSWNLDDVKLTTPGQPLTATCSFDVTVLPYEAPATDNFCENSTYTFGSQTISAAGTYTEVFSAAGGCDSTIVMTLTTNPVFADTLVADFCAGSTYTWAGQAITAPGFYYDSLLSMSNCDSIKVLNLSELLPTNDTIVDSFCAGGTYMFDGATLSAPGYYVQTLVSTVTGCDSLITLNLTQIALPVLTVASVTDEMIGADGTLTINVSGGSTYTYMWSNGATTQNLTGLVAGVYSVTVTDVATGCTQVLQATVGSQVGIDDVGFENIIIYPNPSSGKFTISSKDEVVERIIIFDATGRIVLEMNEGIQEEQVIDLSNVTSGIYQIRMIGNAKTAVKSVIIR